MNGALSALTLAVFLGWVAWMVFRPADRPAGPSPTAIRGALQWLRVLGCRVVSLSRRVGSTGPTRPPRVREHAGGALIVSDEGAQRTQHVRALKRVHPLTPPATPLPVEPAARLDAWVRRELTDPRNPRMRAHVAREAARVHGVTIRTAQRAVRRVAGGAR